MSTPTEIYVAVMGVTGSGKSSFIKCCVGKDDIVVGHDLKCCTKDVNMHSHDHSPSIRVNLIDTPGFDDDNLSDADVLQKISNWLADLYRGEIKLNGLLYLHRITDNRLQGTARKNLAVFQKVCGNDALKNVTLVSTMWDMVRDCQDSVKRENQLLQEDEFWGEMVQKHGTHVGRHYNTNESAMQLLARFIESPNNRVVVDLQQEVIDGKTLEQTAAGLEVLSEINKAKAVAEKKLRVMEEQLKEKSLEIKRAAEKEQEERLAREQKFREAEKQLEEARAKAEREALDAEWRALDAERKEKEERFTRLKEQEEKMYRERKLRDKLREAQAEMARVAEQKKKEELDKKIEKSYWGSVGAILAGGAASAAAIAAAPATGGVSLAAVPKICVLVGASLVGGKVSRDQARRAALDKDEVLDYTSMYVEALLEEESKSESGEE